MGRDHSILPGRIYVFLLVLPSYRLVAGQFPAVVRRFCCSQERKHRRISTGKEMVSICILGNGLCAGIPAGVLVWLWTATKDFRTARGLINVGMGQNLKGWK